MYVLMIGHPKKIEQLEQDPPEIVINYSSFLPGSYYTRIL
jgi:hypothetical protein